MIDPRGKRSLRGMICLVMPLFCLTFGVHPNARAQASSESRQIAGFPQAGLARLRDAPASAEHEAAVRQHAWNLFAQITTVSGEQEQKKTLWEGWSTKCRDLQLSLWCGTPVVADSGLHELTVQHPATALPGQFSTVYYSPSVVRWIKRKRLYDSRSLRKLIVGTPAHTLAGVRRLEIAGAPDASIVVKEIWEAVNPMDGIWAVKVYNPADYHQATLPEIVHWPTQVTLLTSTDKNGATFLDVTTKCPAGQTHSGQKLLGSAPRSVLPVDCFLYRYERDACSHLLDPTLQPLPAPVPHLEEPCVLVLVGLQVITREKLANWTWSTFWWTMSPVQPGAMDRSAGRDRVHLRPEFRSFAMDTMLPKDGDPTLHTYPAMFNPYLEGIQPEGTKSNCLRCHAAAAYVPQTSLPKPPQYCKASTRAGERNGLRDLMQLAGTVNRAVAQDCTRAQRRDPIANHCALRTSRLWSLATNQNCTSDDPMLNFNNRLIPLLAPRHRASLGMRSRSH